MNSEPNNNPSKNGNGKSRNHHVRRRKSARSAPPRGAKAPSPQRPQVERPPQELKICAVCGKPIFDLTGAVASREDGEPIHFDCAVEILWKEEKLAPDERLVYIGSGYFGICAQTTGGKLEIRRKIRWESTGTIQPWRRPMMSSPNLP